MLRTTAPFKGWRLPHADEIEFRLTAQPGGLQGECWLNGPRMGIDISVLNHGHLLTMVTTLAHEMVHLYQLKLGRDPDHGAFFLSRAAVVCNRLGLDPKAF